MAANETFKDIVPFTGEAEVLPATPFPTQLPMQRSQTQYHTAITVQRPRDIDRVVAAVLREAEFAGDAFYWSWPVKNKRTGRQEIIEGPSIGLAMAVAREWTNCAVPVEYQETAGEWVFTAHFVDLEKGFTVSRVYRRRKGKTQHLDAWGDRNEDMAFQAAQSRAIRNVVAAGVPRWLLDRAMEVAKNAVAEKITPEKLVEASDKAVKFFAGYGIDEARIVAALGVPHAQWATKEILALRGMVSQLKDGQVSAENLFPPVEEKGVRPASEAAKPDRRTRSDKGTKRASETPQDEPGEAAPTPTPPIEPGVNGGPPQAATPEIIASIKTGIRYLGLSEVHLCQEYEVSKLKELNQEAAMKMMTHLREEADKRSDGPDNA